VEIPEITPVVIQVETPGTAQVELPVVPPEAEQPSRFFFAVLSGVVFFAAYAPVTIGNKTIDALIYSVTYNGSYLAAEGIITIIVISIPPVKKALDYVKQMANSR
jgi:thiamine transporter